MKSKAAIQVEAAGPLVIEEIDIPDPGPNQVTVRSFASGCLLFPAAPVAQPWIASANGPRP